MTFILWLGASLLPRPDFEVYNYEYRCEEDKVDYRWENDYMILIRHSTGKFQLLQRFNLSDFSVGGMSDQYPATFRSGFPVMEVGIETGKINKNERKEKNSRNSHLGHEHAENSRCPCIRPA